MNTSSYWLTLPPEVFFFSSRRRHTRWTGDWSSDVCSSDLGRRGRGAGHPGRQQAPRHPRSEERRVGKSVDLGGRRIIKKKKKKERKAKEEITKKRERDVRCEDNLQSE